MTYVKQLLQGHKGAIYFDMYSQRVGTVFETTAFFRIFINLIYK